MNTRVITGGPWPQRIGKQCRIVDAPNAVRAQIYPWGGLGANEVVISIEDDPLTSVAGRYWSCVINRKDLTPIGDQ